MGRQRDQLPEQTLSLEPSGKMGILQIRKPEVLFPVAPTVRHLLPQIVLKVCNLGSRWIAVTAKEADKVWPIQRDKVYHTIEGAQVLTA